MIEYNTIFETMDAHCDGCEMVDAVEGTFLECIKQLREKGWKITKNGQEWEHFCPDCNSTSKDDVDG